MLFDKKTLMWKIYNTNKALFIIEQVLIINKKDFIIAVLGANSKTFIVYMAILEQEKILIYFKRQAQIKT